MLGLPKELIERAAGNQTAGFYRPKPSVDTSSTRGLEVYSWGGLTSGPATRALWLLLLPFILVNLAHWMLPPAGRSSRIAAAAGRISVRLLRLIGLSLTLTMMLAAALAVMDVTVWQCAGLDYCGSRLGPASFLADLPRGAQLALGALPVALMIGGILLLGRANPYVVKGCPPDPAVRSGEVPLAEHEFWVGDVSVTRLRACHVMAWASGLAGLALFTPARYGDSADALGLVLLGVNAAILTVAVVATAINRVTGRGGPGADGLTRPLQLLQWISVGVLAVSLVWVAVAPTSYPDPPTHLPGLRGSIYLLLATQAVLFAALFAATALARATEFTDGFRPTLRGFAAPLTATIAWLVGGGFSTGLGLLAAQFLGTPLSSTVAAECEISVRRTIIDDGGLGDVSTVCDAQRRSELPQLPAGLEDRVHAINDAAPLIVPPPFFWVAIIFVALLLILALLGLGIWLRVVRPRTKSGQAWVLRAYTAHPSGAEQERAKAIAAARARASAADLAIPLAAGLAMVAVAILPALLVVYLVLGFQSLPSSIPTLTNLSVTIIAAAVAVLGAVAIWAFRSRDARRMVGILWDIATFWPRANHPLTPPCYAEQAVPQLLGRITTLSTDPTHAVVVAAHSQGSVIAAAAMLQAGPKPPERAALLTFGSPLRRLYARNFPAYFSVNTLKTPHIQERRRWINMWALSDPVGSWVLSEGTRIPERALDEVDLRLLDVTSLNADDGGDLPPIVGHSGFWQRPEYGVALSLLVSAVLPGPSTPDQTPSPATDPDDV